MAIYDVPSSVSRPMKDAAEQPDSKLLCLPAEMRTYIYELVLTVKPNKHGHVVIFGPRATAQEDNDTGQSAEIGDWLPPTTLSILQTCRLVNREAAGIFYHENHIQLQPKSGYQFQSFLDTLSRPRLDGIRSLSLRKSYIGDFWDMCSDIADRQLCSLQKLDFQLDRLPSYRASELRLSQSPYLEDEVARLNGAKHVSLTCTLLVPGESKVAWEAFVEDLNALLPSNVKGANRMADDDTPLEKDGG